MLPRHAFSVRDAARAGDVWRAFQEVAVEGSSRAGWPPLRYRSEGAAFVMRTMTVVHHREALYGEPLTARTWVRRFRREMLSTREVRLTSSRGKIASGTQEWVHVSKELAPTRASKELTDAFPVIDVEGETAAELPSFDALEGPTHTFEFEAWHTWMDPLDHVNHPAYVDFVDEATSRVMADAGLPPVQLRPIAEKVTYTRGVIARETVRIETRPIGRIADAVVLAHEVFVGDASCAKITTVRDLAEGSGLVEAFATV